MCAGALDFYPCMIDSGIKLGCKVSRYVIIAQKEWYLQYALMVKGQRCGSATPDSAGNGLNVSPVRVPCDSVTQATTNECVARSMPGCPPGHKEMVFCRGIPGPENIHCHISLKDQSLYLAQRPALKYFRLLLKDLAYGSIVAVVLQLHLSIAALGYDISLYRSGIHSSLSVSGKHQSGTHAGTIRSGSSGLEGATGFMEASGDEDSGDVGPFVSAEVNSTLVRSGELQADIRGRHLPHYPDNLSLIHI